MVACGMTCMWWDDASRAKVQMTLAGDVLRCPHCGGHCELYPDRDSFLKMARRFENLGFVGHRALIEWAQGRCYRTRADAWHAYLAESIVLEC